jgi:alanine racemase
VSETRILSPRSPPPDDAPGQRPADRRRTPRGSRAEPPDERPTWVEVDLDAVTRNVAALRAQAATDRLMAVVKADGYGHGMVPVARAALAGGAEWLAVALVEEGLALRAAGVDAPVLVMTEPPAAAIPALVEGGLTPAVYSSGFSHALDAYARDRGAPIAVHVKLDTGMRRVGVPQADWEDALTTVRDAGGLRFEGLWSHYAVADEPDHPFIEHQSREFARALELAGRLGVRPAITHLANSAGTLHLHEHHHDMVRPGLAIYGLEPAPGLAGDTALEPALSWWARLSLVKRLAAGEAVSYGLVWAPEADTTVGTVPAGYADGVVRALTNVGEAVVHGRRVRYAGRVCMDQLVLDLGDLPARAGDEVALIGRQGGAAVTADDWAGWLGTINYEIVCGIGKRVPRVHLGAATGADPGRARPPDGATGPAAAGGPS